MVLTLRNNIAEDDWEKLKQVFVDWYEEDKKKIYFEVDKDGMYHGRDETILEVTRTRSSLIDDAACRSDTDTNGMTTKHESKSQVKESRVTREPCEPSDPLHGIKKEPKEVPNGISVPLTPPTTPQSKQRRAADNTEERYRRLSIRRPCYTPISRRATRYRWLEESMRQSRVTKPESGHVGKTDVHKRATQIDKAIGD